MYTALYRTYRPEVFDEILGQEHIVRILRNQINTDSTSHAYLFCGTRGTGKTTVARILAKGLNCLSEGEKPCGKCSSCLAIKEGTFLDVIEIDAASNNGVDNIRELRESVKYPPVLGSKKVYIIDEVHMLSTGAFNALLKTLEEPPPYVVFILATTEPQKLPATILSRCMKLDFKRVPENLIAGGMKVICQKRGIDITGEALRIIAANSDGSVRDGLSILDQCISGGDEKIDAKDVLEFLGASGEETFTALTELVRKGKTPEAIVLLAEALSDGKDVRQFIRDWINHYRNLLMVKFVRNPQEVLSLSVENIERIRRQSEALELGDINHGILELSRTMNEAKWSTQPRILLELAIVKLCGNVETLKTVRPAPPKSQPAAETCRDDEENVSSPDTLELFSKSSKETSEEPFNGDDDLDALWNAVFEEGEASKGSFYIIGSRAHIKMMDEGTFTVEAESDHVRQHAEKNRELLERLMEKHTGKARAMRVICRQSSNRSQGRDVRKIASEAEKLLGIDIEIHE